MKQYALGLTLMHVMLVGISFQTVHTYKYINIYFTTTSFLLSVYLSFWELLTLLKLSLIGILYRYSSFHLANVFRKIIYFLC